MSSAEASAGKVYLVGAGPGDPDLLTVKAVRLLAEADVVLHDDLVPQSIVDLSGKQALVMSVGKRCGRKKITAGGNRRSDDLVGAPGFAGHSPEVRRPHDFWPRRGGNGRAARGLGAL